MEINKLNNAYKYNYDTKYFKEAFNWLKNTNLKSLPVGKYEIDGDKVFAYVQEYNSLEFDECLFEAHLKYHDIQYIVEGVENFGFADATRLLIDKDYDEDKDVVFFKFPTTYSVATLQSGSYIIASPTDAFQPRVKHEKSMFVKKIVVKVIVE
ncbi:MAG: YhcH/YjgK/YiaL family protein [Acholeplasmatales bacterium]|nr:YhcH/YjgK/YiaL family protein [Acholeplasmatales bacterium]